MILGRHPKTGHSGDHRVWRGLERVGIAQAADIVGARAVLVHAIDQQAGKFYEHFDFEASLSQELHLMLLMKDLRKALQ